MSHKHNLISFNQLAEWTEHESEEDSDVINDYFDCVIECADDDTSCKRVCKEILI